MNEIEKDLFSLTYFFTLLIPGKDWINKPLKDPDQTVHEYLSHFVGNKPKRRISKRVFQKNKVRQIFRKHEHFLPPDTHTGVSNVRFWENLA